MKSDTIASFAVIIIESLAENDVKTGSILHREVVKYKKFQEPELTSELYHVSSKVGLQLLLTTIAERIKINKLFPIIHIETHGGEEGIVLKSGEEVLWSELIPYFRDINILLGNELVLIMSMCVGLKILGVVMPDERAPFRAIVAASNDVSQIDLRNGFESFYDNFFFSFDLETSTDMLNQAIGNERPTFYVLTADYIFKQVLDINRDPIHFEGMINQMAIEQKALNPAYLGLPFDDVLIDVRKTILNLFIQTREKQSWFLMADLRSS